MGITSESLTHTELAGLLTPVSVEMFLAEFWGRKPLYIRGDEAKLRRLFPERFDRDTFIRDAHCARAAGNPDFAIWSQKQRRCLPGQAFAVVDIEPEEIGAAVAAGANVGCARDHPNPHEPLVQRTGPASAVLVRSMSVLLSEGVRRSVEGIALVQCSR